MLRSALAALIVVFALGPALAQQDDVRAKDLFNQLRCVVCQNQSIASSEAGVAKDLRQLVREQIDEGKSDPEIIDYLVDRYGEFVLLKPRLSPHTILLWLSPLLVGLFGVFLIVRMRSSKAQPIAPLRPEEETRLAQLLTEKSSARR